MPPKASAKPAAKVAAPAAKPAAKPQAKAKAAAPAGKAAPGAKAAPKAAAKQAAAGGGGAAAGGNTNGVYIKGLRNENCAEVRRLLEDCGAIKDVRLRRNKFALVWFDNQQGANRAIEQFNGRQIKSNTLSVTRARAAPAHDNKSEAVSVFVSPIFRLHTSKSKLTSLFEGCGTITKMKMYRFNYAFIRFDSHAGVVNALKKNGTELFNKTLTVKPSIRK